MVFSLSERAVMHPTAGSFGTYAETYLNPWAGFVVRYTYWIAQVIAIGGEAVAAGVYMTYWVPDTPVWVWSLGFAFILLYVNSRSVGDFGTFEYRSEEHTSELQSLMRISYAVFCLKKKQQPDR